MASATNSPDNAFDPPARGGPLINLVSCGAGCHLRRAAG